MSDVSTGIVDPGTPVSGTSGPGLATSPKPLTSFIGRERELATARQLLQASGLLTPQADNTRPDHQVADAHS
jgi:hypothetical protein